LLHNISLSISPLFQSADMMKLSTRQQLLKSRGV